MWPQVVVESGLSSNLGARAGGAAELQVCGGNLWISCKERALGRLWCSLSPSRHSTPRGCARLTAASKLAALSNYREWLILALMCQLLLLMEVYTGIIARPESRETVTVLPVPPMEAPVQ